MTVVEEFAVLVEQFFGFPEGRTFGSGDEIGMFGMSVSCWLAIDFSESGVYTSCRIRNTKVLKRSEFV